MCQRAQCKDLESIETAIKQWHIKSAAQSKRSTLETQLRSLSGGQDIDRLLQDVGNHDRSELTAKLSRLKDDAKQIESELNCQRETLWDLRRQWSSIDSESAASEESQNLHLQIGELRGLTDRYKRLKLASLILDRAIDHYCEANQGPVLQLASELFSELTIGKYDGLKIEPGDQGVMLFGVQNESPVPASAMSSGTADSLYFALRLASLQQKETAAEPMPLILDDCLMQMDDDRASAALSVLARFAQQTQVILLTHHRHVLELAEQTLMTGQFRRHELGQETESRTTLFEMDV